MSLIGITLLSFGGASLSTPATPKDEDQTAEVHLLRGQAYLDKEQYQEALAEFNKALTLNANLVEARYHLGLAQWNLGRHAVAAENFERTLQLAPYRALSYYYLGQISVRNNDLPKAIEYFERAIDQPKTKLPLDVYFQLGKTHLTQGNLEAGIRMLERGASLHPRDDRIYTQLAKAYMRLGRKQEADRALVKSKELRDYQREATQWLLQCSEYLKAREAQKALEIYNKLINSIDLDDLVASGITFGQSELYEQAINLLVKAVGLDQDSFEANYNLGLMLLRTEKLEEAEARLSKAVELRPYSFEANSLLGVLLSQRGKNEPAIRALSRAEQLRPGDLKIMTLLGLQLIEGRYYAAAIETLRKGVERHSDNLELRFLLVQAYYQYHDFERALQEAEDTLRRAPDSPRANFEVGFQLKNFGRFKEAKPYFLKSITLDPSYADAYYSVGELLLMEEKHEEALSYFREAIDRDPNRIDSYLGLAKALLALRKYSAVVQEMEKAITIDPKNPQSHLHLSQAFLALGEKQKAAQEAETFKALNVERMTRRDLEEERKLQNE